MRKTLDEHIARIKKLSLINEADASIDPNKDDVNTGDSPLDDAIESPEFANKMEEIIKGLVDDVDVDDINRLGNVVGDRDGTLTLQGESYDINEAGLAVVGGAIIAAPKIMNMIGKGVRQLGIKTKSEWIRSAGEAAYEASHKLEHAYQNVVINGLRKLPKYAKTEDAQLRSIASGIILGLTVAAGIASLSGLASAAQAGNVGLSAVEGGLTGVKGAEVATAARTMLPNILNGLFK
jgi:hypothetical protein